MLQAPCLFRLATAEYWAPSGATLYVYTDLPTGLALRETLTLPATTTAQRVCLSGIALKGTTQGRMLKVRLTDAGGGSALFRLAFYIRRMGRQATDWVWWELPEVSAPTDQFITLKVPIPESPTDLLELRVPIPESSTELLELKVPVPASDDALLELKVPVPPSSEELLELKVPVPESPDALVDLKVPIPESPDALIEVKVPVPVVQERQEWTDLAMDE